MRHHIETLLIFLFVCLSTTAQEYYEQHKLGVEDLSDGVSVFSTDGEWAGVIVQCKKQYDLTFYSDVDDRIVDVSNNPVISSKLYKKESALLIKKEEDNSNKYYHFMFLTGKKYDSRRIRVNYSYFHPGYIGLLFLSPKSLHRYRVYDESEIGESTKFQEHRLKGQKYFTDCNYTAAKQEFTLAKYCVEATEEDKENVQASINKCDSMLYWIKEGNLLAQEGLYSHAITYFHKAAMHNYMDKYTFNRYYELSRKQSNLCSIYYAEAEKYYRDKDYETAKGLYQTVVDRGCMQEETASKKIAECNVLIRKRINTERYIGLDIGLGEDATIGITSGTYGKRIGSYISLRTNRELFELARSNYNMNDLAILDATVLGLSFPIIKPQGGIFQGTWISAGVGGSVMNKYKVREVEGLLEVAGKNDYDELTQEDIDCYIDANGGKGSKYLGLNIGFAVSPEIGVFVKLWRLGLRLNYQKRIIATKSFKNNKHIKEDCIYFGIGYCF